MAFLRTVSRCNSLVPRKVSSPSSTGTNGCLSHSRSEQFLRQYGIHAASNHRGQLSSALLAALNHRLTLEGHPSLDGTRRWRSTTVAAPSPVSTGARQRQQQDNNPSTPQRDPLDVSFNDPHAAFKSKTTFELIRAYFVYVLCSSEFLVENNMKIMKLMRAILGDRLFVYLMKQTFYGHFVAGEDRIRIVPTLTRLRSFGVKPILDYSVEEDLSQEEAEKREVEASVSSAGTNLSEDSADSLPQYSVDKTFADRRYKVQSARTYFYLNEATCERNMETFLECLDAVKGATFGTGITAIKLTALGRPQLLLQVSEVIMQARRYMMDLAGSTGNILTHHKTIQDLERYLGNVSDKAEVKQFLEKVTSDKDGILHLFPWTGIINEDCQLSETFRVPDPVTGQMRRLISKIPPKEEEMFRNMIRRLNTIVKTAQDLDVRIMIDAEQTYFQPAISRITLEMMRKYNTEKAIVFNTYQCYLKDTYKEVCTDLEQAKRQNFYFGAKLVRGAYIEQERARAAALGYEDPTNPSFEATTEMYHKTLTECLRRIRILKDANIDPKKIAIMVASHNEDTVRFAIEKMQEIGIHPEDKVICFGQLLGMCDYITFPLGQAGYSAYKYIPYGPVNEVLPYLSRRAQENKGVLQKIKKEKRLLLSEITKRLAKGQLFYKPKGKYVPI
ncbi:proline dehydrogenase 1, mitochondrial isoform X1 [Anopheles arabiensis]|uniref:Proline dehydrogenase n=3 Tax=gambiae species complex TaxID=44542 RepID=A0A8W7PN35_ANOCL|nr:proline dehydrogenase 1, mitochondrial isoform X1 [Anopheles arabiensis]XP_040151589.1 proline dehydrogenase 1, mitochondrial isoform X1 [Anopheles arabiensis]XP_040151590.1 proline dehydrogenase 1, mitochondrial isoform X1 [Anopheles arabiensis]XP_061497665.1 proline dehydrogenase 1, mitochondrial isoform X1 [Anopheles gambiae]XP_061497667.1 proline dehydrogenase 1, mitochondrial isoform X1 [Anopheles gambiae]XP_061497668.1 proline dehydrogenase 1, mitochondrial isoform X1 [Anopheles gambi